MAQTSKRLVNTATTTLIVIECLTTSVLLLGIITLVAGKFPHSLQKSPILTFNASSFKTQLANPNVPDWYEIHYLSVCKGMWQTGNLKNEASKICKPVSGGYKFSLPDWLAADAGLPVDSPIFSNWLFAVVNTKMAFICLTVAIAFTSLSTIAYFITIVTTPKLKRQSPLFWSRLGYLSSIVALNTFILSSAKITAEIHKVLKNEQFVGNGVAWSTHSFYALTWLATALILVVVILSIILAFRLR